MKVCVLASGSSGNCIYVGAGSAHLLIDAGLSGRETARRLEEIGVKLAEIQAVCLTHEHNDHIAGLSVLHSRHGIALYANAGTAAAVRLKDKLSDLTWHIFSTGAAFKIGEIVLEPFAVSHDAYEPVGFIIKYGANRVGIVTDIGISTHLVRERLKGCCMLIVESNHDQELLSSARRPWSLKQRIAGRQGHLSNQHAAELIAGIAGPHLSQVFLSHLSDDCNRPELALKAAQTALRRQGQNHVQVKLTFADRPSEIWRSSCPGREPASA